MKERIHPLLAPFVVVSGGGLPTDIHISGAPLVQGCTAMPRRPIGGSSQTRHSTTSRVHYLSSRIG